MTLGYSESGLSEATETRDKVLIRIVSAIRCR